MTPLARAYAEAIHHSTAFVTLMACAPFVAATAMMGGRKPLPDSLTRTLKAEIARQRDVRGRFAKRAGV